jgi:hypothetical protein
MAISSSDEDTVVDFPNSSPPKQSPLETDDDSMSYVVAIVNTSIRVLNARLIGILALMGAIGVWSLAAIDPSGLRIWAAAGYSLGVLLPSLMIYSRKG